MNSVYKVGPEGITVGGELISNSVILTPDRIFRDWPVKSVATVTEQDFAPAIEAECDVIVFGTGDRPIFPPRSVVFAFARRGIGFEAMDTVAACRTFNILVGEGRRAAAALILGNVEN
jgi:uncharacterized protein